MPKLVLVLLGFLAFLACIVALGLIPIYVRYGNKINTATPAKKFTLLPNCSNQAISPKMKRINPLIKIINGETAVESIWIFI